MTISMLSFRKKIKIYIYSVQESYKHSEKGCKYMLCLWSAVRKRKSKTGNEFGSNRVLEARAITHLFQVIIVLWQNIGLLNIIFLRFPAGENSYLGVNDTSSQTIIVSQHKKLQLPLV